MNRRACTWPKHELINRRHIGETWANESASLHVALDDRDTSAVRAGATLGSTLLVPRRHRLLWWRVLLLWWVRAIVVAVVVVVGAVVVAVVVAPL